MADTVPDESPVGGEDCFCEWGAVVSAVCTGCVDIFADAGK
jgi:hypothetical protein